MFVGVTLGLGTPLLNSDNLSTVRMEYDVQVDM